MAQTKPLDRQVADLKTDIAKRIKEAAQLDVDAQRLVLTDSESSINSASRAVAIRGLLPLLRKGLADLVAQLMTQRVAEAEAEIDREVARQVVERAKDFPTLQSAIYALGRTYNTLVAHPDAPRLLRAFPFLSPDAFRPLVEGGPALLESWRAADRQQLEDEAKKKKVEARKRIEESGQDLLDDGDGQDAREVSA